MENENIKPPSWEHPPTTKEEEAERIHAWNHYIYKRDGGINKGKFLWDEVNKTPIPNPDYGLPLPIEYASEYRREKPDQKEC
jgi:hypothetical protein